MTAAQRTSLSDEAIAGREVVLRAVPTGTQVGLGQRGWRRGAKRAMDLLLTVLLLPLAVLIVALIAVVIRTTSRGPVMFRQTRVGRDGNPFEMVKFRTMRVDSEERLRADKALWNTYVQHDYKVPADIDPRLTRVGRLIRRWSLDEIPQLLNVARGSMSIVGPRPVTPEQLASWGRDATAYLSVKPGLTGLWQINGRSGVRFDERVGYDAAYVEGWTIRRDLRIIALTPVAVLSRRGAH